MGRHKMERRNLICWLACAPLLAAAATNADAAVTVRAVQTVDNGAAGTRVSIALTGAARPTISGDGRRVVVFLPDAVAQTGLASRLTSGGVVSQIALESTPAPAVRLTLNLSRPARASVVASGVKNQICVALTEDTPSETPIIRRASGFTVNAYNSDVAGLLRSLARQAGVSIVLTGAAGRKVTVSLQAVPLETAFDLLCKASGLIFHQDGATYVFGPPADVQSAYPAPVLPPEQAVYHCRYVSASDLSSSLLKSFDKDALRVSLGASPLSPKLGDLSAMSTGGGSSGAASGGGAAAGGETPGLGTHEIVLTGSAEIVRQALTLASKLDMRRGQVRIGVRITDISLNALKELGVRWTFGDYILHENGKPTGLSFGKFVHDPISLDASIAALEQNNSAKLLAAPTLTLLDNEHGYILIGDRLLYPKLTGYTQAQTPIYDKEEVRVGIYLQVAAQMSGDGEITLTIAPQVSSVTGFLTVNGASYPQISTREQQTTIRVKDGEKIVVGGLIRDDEITAMQNVPLLSKLPVLGELFKYRKTTRARSEVVIMITPEILKD